MTKFMATLHHKRSGWSSVPWNYSSLLTIKNICVSALNLLMFFSLLTSVLPVCQNDL